MLGSRLRQLRDETKITQKALAKRLAIDRTTYIGYEKDRREPDIETIIKIANYYSVTLDYLVGRTIQTQSVIEFTYDEIELIKKYRSLDEDGKGAVKNTLDFECKRAQGKSDGLSRKTSA